MVLTTWLTLSLIASTSLAYIIDWQCDWDLYHCDYPYSIEETLQFSCVDSNDCPVNFVCCSHRCFTHKICQPSKNTQVTKPPDESTATKPGTCDVSIQCDIPLPSEFTKAFECFVDDDCPDHYKCCIIECYNHKVCQRAKDIFPLTISTTLEATSSRFSNDVNTTSSAETTDGENLDLESTTVTTNKETTEYVTETTTTRSSTEESTTLTVPAQIIQQTDDNTMTKDSSIIIEYPNNAKSPTIVPTTPNIRTSNSVTVVKSKTNLSETSEGPTKDTTEIDDSEASGYVEISGDDEDDINTPTSIREIEKTTGIITEGYDASGDMGITKDDEDEITAPIHVAANTTSAASDDSEASGDFEIIEDDEDNATVFTSTHTTVLTTSTATNDLEGSGDLEIPEDDEDFIVIFTSTHSVETTSTISSDSTSDDFEIIDNKDGITNNNSTVHIMETTSKTEAPAEDNTNTDELKISTNEGKNNIVSNYTRTETMSSVTDNSLIVESTTMRTANNKSVVEIDNGEKKDNNITTSIILEISTVSKSVTAPTKLNSEATDFDTSKDGEDIFSGSGDDNDEENFDDNEDNDDDDDYDDEPPDFTASFSKGTNISADKENTKESDGVTESQMSTNKKINVETGMGNIDTNIESIESLDMANITEISPIKDGQDYHGKEDEVPETTEVAPKRSEIVEEATVKADIETIKTNSSKSETTTEKDYEPIEVDEDESATKTDLNTTESKSEKSDVVVENISNITKQNSSELYHEEFYDDDYEEDYEEEPTEASKEGEGETQTSNVVVENIPKLNITDSSAMNSNVADNNEDDVEDYEDYDNYEDY